MIISSMIRRVLSRGYEIKVVFMTNGWYYDNEIVFTRL
jgi:hypothetical protein